MSTQFQNANKIKFMPLPYIGMFDLDVIYQSSDAELLYHVLYKLNEIAKSQNIIIDNFQKIIEWATEQIEKFTKEQLEEWLNDGTLSNMLLALGKIVKYIDTTVEMLHTDNIVKNQLIKTTGYNTINDSYGGLFYITDVINTSSIQLTLDSGLYATLIVEDYFHINQIGGVITDLNRLLNCLVKNDMDIYLTGVKLTCSYPVDVITNINSLKINFTDSNITVNTPFNTTSGAILNFNQCNNIEIIGGIFNGNNTGNTAGNVNTEQCHCFNAINTDNFICHGSEIFGFDGDGIQFGSNYTTNFTPNSCEIYNMEIHDVHRNGISILDGKNVNIHNCYIYDISLNPNNPVIMPICSVDCEPFNSNQRLINISISDIRGSTDTNYGNGGGIALFSGNGKTHYNLSNITESGLKIINRFSSVNSEYIVKISNVLLHNEFVVNGGGASITGDISFSDYNAQLNSFRFADGDNYNVNMNVNFLNPRNSGSISQMVLPSFSSSRITINTNATNVVNPNYLTNSNIVNINPTTSRATAYYQLGLQTLAYTLLVDGQQYQIVNPSSESFKGRSIYLSNSSTSVINNVATVNVSSNVSFPYTLKKGDIVIVQYIDDKNILVSVK